MQKNIYGKRGEIIASNFLKSKGYNIIQMNYRNVIGEIDIIASHDGTLVFVEVKTRTSRGFGDPFEAINYKKQQKIRQVAMLYLKQKRIVDKVSCRFDAIAILGDDDKDIRHIENAF